MADISIRRKHSVEPSVLRGRLEELAVDLERKYGVRSRWTGNTCSLDGAGLKKGIVTYTDDSLSIEVTLGMMARMLKGRIESEIESKLAGVLGA